MVIVIIRDLPIALSSAAGIQNRFLKYFLYDDIEYDIVYEMLQWELNEFIL